MRPDRNSRDAAREFEAARIAAAKAEVLEKAERRERERKRREREKREKKEDRRELALILSPILLFIILIPSFFVILMEIGFFSIKVNLLLAIFLAFVCSIIAALIVRKEVI